MYDLPIAVGMLIASKSVPPGGLDPARTLFAGELAVVKYVGHGLVF